MYPGNNSLINDHIKSNIQNCFPTGHKDLIRRFMTSYSEHMVKKPTTNNPITSFRNSPSMIAMVPILNKLTNSQAKRLLTPDLTSNLKNQASTFGEFLALYSQSTNVISSYQSFRIVDPRDYRTIILASDGLWDNLTSAQIFAVYSQSPSSCEAEHLVNAAIKANKKPDDVTVQVTKINYN
jgi:serine/threonine protein phosphatase PrpC